MTAHPNPPVPEACEPIHYTAREFLACRRELRDILIAPFDESKCKGIGYNISPSELCYSVKKKHLLQIHRTEQEIYVLIPPHDTILTLSHEYLQISAEVAGCFLSRLHAPARKMRDCKVNIPFAAGFPIGARSIPVGTRFCFAKSSVLYLCFRLTRKRGWRRTLRCGRVWRQTLFRGRRTGGFCDVSYSTNAGFSRSKIRLAGKGSRGI